MTASKDGSKDGRATQTSPIANTRQPDLTLHPTDSGQSAGARYQHPTRGKPVDHGGLDQRLHSYSLSSNANSAPSSGNLDDRNGSLGYVNVRTLPSWLRSYHEGDDEDEADPTKRLLSYPMGVQVAQHHHAPTNKPPGRVWDHARTHTPVLPKNPAHVEASRWRTFAESSGLPPTHTASGEKVDEEWLQKNMRDLEGPWNPAETMDEGLEKRGTFLSNWRKRKAWYKRLHRALLHNPIVPLIFRLVIAMFSLVALALGASIYSLTKKYGLPQTPSTVMAIAFDAVALIYVFYVTYDEYTSKPLGLRSPRAKMLLVLFDLFFIVFNSANLSLAFVTLSDRQGSCRRVSSDETDTQDADFCDRQEALSGVLLIALVAWLMTFTVSVFRLVERVVRK